MSASVEMRPCDVLRDAAGIALLRTNHTAAERSGVHLAQWLADQAERGPDGCSDLAIAVAQVIMASGPA